MNNTHVNSPQITTYVNNGMELVPEEHRNRGLAAGTGATIGGVLGSFLGGPIGAAVGAALGGPLAIAISEKGGVR